ncbi:MAG: hypothetical protein ACR2QM_17995 [Longimicrobiales bacterium]
MADNGATSVFAGLLARMARESAGKSWVPRAPLLLVLAWFFVQHARDFSHHTIVSGINLVMHEGGHLFFMWFGVDFLTVAGGTLFQLVIPVLVAGAFFRQQDHFGVAVALFWFGISLAEVGPYAADARWQLLPLVSPFPGAPLHDWHYLLSTLGVLAHDQEIGKAFHHSGVLVMASAFALGIWVLRCMARAPKGVEMRGVRSTRAPTEPRPPGPGGPPHPAEHHRREEEKVPSTFG